MAVICSVLYFSTPKFTDEQLSNLKFEVVGRKGDTAPATYLLAYDVRALGSNNIKVVLNDKFSYHLDFTNSYQYSQKDTIPFYVEKPVYGEFALYVDNILVNTVPVYIKSNSWQAWQTVKNTLGNSILECFLKKWNCSIS